jgi:phytoene/squalene synthetase
MATRSDALQSSRRFQLYANTNWGDSLHPCEQQGNTVRTLRSLVRKLRSYILHLSGRHGNTVRTQSLLWQLHADRGNRLDSRATLFGRSLNMKTREARYGKLVAQKTVRTLYASIRMPPREIRDRLDLGLLSI